MIELVAPSLTKYVPTMEVTMQVAQIASGYSIAALSIGVSPKKMAASTMVATTVTA